MLTNEEVKALVKAKMAEISKLIEDNNFAAVEVTVEAHARSYTNNRSFYLTEDFNWDPSWDSSNC